MAESVTPKAIMKISYVLASTHHGTFIINRNDENQNEQYGTYGVGSKLFETGSFFQTDIDLLVSILRLKKQESAGRRPVVAIDCGANLGVHTIEFARELEGVGNVISIEAQKPVYYALCGNIAINNCFNVDARNVAVGGVDGALRIPFVDYHKRSSFGSLELRKSDANEHIGQTVDYDAGYEVPLVKIDSLNQNAVDLIKIDVEGMEEETISGAVETLKNSTPVLFIEKIKSNFAGLESIFRSLKYDVHDVGPNIIAVSQRDPNASRVRDIISSQSIS